MQQQQLQAIASSGEVVVQLEQRLQALRLERVEEREAAAEAAAHAKAEAAQLQGELAQQAATDEWLGLGLG